VRGVAEAGAAATVRTTIARVPPPTVRRWRSARGSAGFGAGLRPPALA